MSGSSVYLFGIHQPLLTVSSVLKGHYIEGFVFIME